MSILLNHHLSIVLWIPVLSVISLILFNNKKMVRWIATVFSGFILLLSSLLFLQFNPNIYGFQLVEKFDLLRSSNFEIHYLIGLDGFSLTLLLMSSILFFLSFLMVDVYIQERQKEFLLYLTLIEFGVIGILLSLDYILFYVFWELIVIPMALLIGIWGGADRVKASIKYMIFSFAGSLFMLGGILYLSFKMGSTNLLESNVSVIYNLPGEIKTILFLSFMIAFSIKTPIFPLHTWMPDVHTQAPTVGSVDLAGILMKVGVFGIVRFCVPLFPSSLVEYQEIFIVLALIGIVYGALLSLIQKDSKRLVAYTSLSHMGYIVIGIFSFNSIGITGGMLQMINHGFVSGMMFFLIGMIHERTKTNSIEEMSGLAKLYPVLSLFFMIGAFAMIGVPATNNFIGELLIVVGVFKENFIYSIIVASGIIFSAAYMLWFAKKQLFGEPKKLSSNTKDATFVEKFILISLSCIILVTGLFPNLIIDYLKIPSEGIVKMLENSQKNKLIEENLTGEEK